MQTAAYVRVSSDKQDTERQEADIRASGIPVDFWIHDKDGKNPRDLPEKRPGFQKLLAGVGRAIVRCVALPRDFGCSTENRIITIDDAITRLDLSHDLMR